MIRESPIDLEIHGVPRLPEPKALLGLAREIKFSLTGRVHMPKYIDTHPMGSLTAEQLKKLQTAPKDKFGVTHHDILFNEKENRVYCVLDAPNKDAVAHHHKDAGIQCEWIHEVESTRRKPDSV